MTIREAAAALRACRISSVELTKAALDRIARYDDRLRAFITVTGDEALAAARRADQELAEGRDRGPLHGIPVAVKDVFATRGIRTTCGSKIFADYVPDFDAAVVERLRAAGAVLVGKTNMHELAYGITSANPHYGAVCNPWDPERVPGGSSGGSGAAVAAGMVFMAMGSDTGGSIRIPAAWCGVVGLKPTFGRVSRYGMLPLDFTLDHAGPLTRSVHDAAWCSTPWQASIRATIPRAVTRSKTTSRRKIRRSRGSASGCPRISTSHAWRPAWQRLCRRLRNWPSRRARRSSPCACRTWRP
jgi:aspartyl-tRNA(Asn)/glutamyl-tRNA(Gln) amidotransferase subunit A